jgi:hypothetical protein
MRPRVVERVDSHDGFDIVRSAPDEFSPRQLSIPES